MQIKESLIIGTLIFGVSYGLFLGLIKLFYPLIMELYDDDKGILIGIIIFLLGHLSNIILLWYRIKNDFDLSVSSILCGILNTIIILISINAFFKN
jgi:hypothetical protein